MSPSEWNVGDRLEFPMGVKVYDMTIRAVYAGGRVYVNETGSCPTRAAAHVNVSDLDEKMRFVPEVKIQTGSLSGSRKTSDGITVPEPVQGTIVPIVDVDGTALGSIRFAGTYGVNGQALAMLVLDERIMGSLRDGPWHVFMLDRRTVQHRPAVICARCHVTVSSAAHHRNTDGSWACEWGR